MGSVAPKAFPFPATVGGSQGVAPLNQAQAPTLNSGIGAQPQVQAPSTPPQPTQTPLAQPLPPNPVIKPIMRTPISSRALYGA